MHRRDVLRGIGTAVAGVSPSLAGCAAERRSTGGAGPTTEATPPAHSTVSARPPTPSDPREAFELVGIDAPGTVEISAPWRFAFTVRNVADAARTFATRLSFRTPAADWRRRDWITADWSIAFPVPAGETRTWRSPVTDFNNVARYEFRLELFGATWSVETVPASRRFGEPYETLDATVLAVHGLTVGPDPASAVDDRLRAGGAGRLVRAAVSVRNLTRHTMPHDEPTDLVLAVDSGVIEPTPRPGDARAVLAGPGELTEGWVAFAVPFDRSLENGVVSWRPAHFDGPIRVDWGPEP